jgi:hypothetical protein
VTDDVLTAEAVAVPLGARGTGDAPGAASVADADHDAVAETALGLASFDVPSHARQCTANHRKSIGT